MLRFEIPVDSVNHKNLPVGDLTCLRLPVELENNPSLKGYTPRTAR